jgi:hypothetical protein
MVRSFPELKIRSEDIGNEPTIICGRPKMVQVASQALVPMLNSTIYFSSVANSRPQLLQGQYYVMKPHLGISIRISAISIFKASVHPNNHAFTAGLLNRWTWRIPDHSLAAGTGMSDHY